MATEQTGRRPRRTLQRGLGAGAQAGVVVLVSLLALTVGGAVYSVLAERLRRPQAVFATMAAVAVAAETAAASTRGGGFLVEATVLHLVVATVAVVLIPRLYAGRG